MRSVIETDAINGGIHAALGIELVSAGPDEVVFEMPIGPKVHQPWGILHGGASAVLAESAASVGAYLNCDHSTQYAVGIDLNISHLRPRSSGRLQARATPVRKGRSIHVWSIDLDDDAGNRVAVARCTLAIRNLDAGRA
jgi:1,4-dihydroxy-2-naphthoyl-CoA hydrolase